MTVATLSPPLEEPPRHPRTTTTTANGIPTTTSNGGDPWSITDDQLVNEPNEPDQQPTVLPQRPPFMTERHRSTSAPNVSPSTSRQNTNDGSYTTSGENNRRSHHHLHHPFSRFRRSTSTTNTAAPPPPRPIFPPPPVVEQLPPPIESNSSNVTTTRDEKRNEQEELERRERAMLQQAIEDSKRDAKRNRREEDTELQRALDASRNDVHPPQSPTMSAQEQAELEQALALSAAAEPSSSNSSSVRSFRQQPHGGGRSRSVSNPEGLPPFPFTEEDLVRPSYPTEKSRLFPTNLPSLPPGAGSTNDESEREMEMLALAIRMSEEEERYRKEREERELREVVRRVEERERSSLSSSSSRPPVPRRPSPPQEDEATPIEDESSSKRQSSRQSWFRPQPPLASKLSTASPPASPPQSPESVKRPSLDAIPTDSTYRSGATSFRSAVESLPFQNLIQTANQTTTTAVPPPPPHPKRQAPPPPPPTRLPPSPPETPVVSSNAFPSVAPPVPPLPPSTTSSRHQQQSSSYYSGFPPSPTTASGPPGVPFPSAHSEAFRLENDGSPTEMPYLTPSTSNSIRSMYRGGTSDGAGRRTSWALDERTGSNSGSGGSGSTGEHSRVNSSNRRSSEIGGGSNDGNGSDGGAGGGDDRSEDSVLLAVRNPDSNALHHSVPSPDPSAVPLAFDQRHEGGFTEEPPTTRVDVPRDVDENDYLHHHNGEGVLFESAYAGRSMSAIDEATEPASSIIAVDDHRQGSYTSTIGTGESTAQRSLNDDELEELGQRGGGGGEEMGRTITYQPRPVEESTWWRPTQQQLPPPIDPQSQSSRTPTPPRSQTQAPSSRPTSSRIPGEIHARQLTHSSAVSSADPRFTFPLPPSSGSNLPPSAASPIVESPTIAQPEISTSASAAERTPTPPSDIAFSDGTRYGHPSICAREPGHVCPDDGLTGSHHGVPESIELTAISSSSSGENSDASIGLGFGDRAGRDVRSRRREETGGKRILRDAWAVEARSWGALLRFLMWYGDTTLVASPEDIALEPTRHCTAEASLEFRPDDEGYTVLRLLVVILPPDDPDSHSHRELTVEHPGSTSPQGKGKGKSKSSYFSSNPDQLPLSTFHLPDSVHLPCRFSNLAIQLYTLRHLASIARSTQPAKEGAAPGYLALRELSGALEGLTAIAKGRQERDARSNGTRVGGSEIYSSPVEGRGGGGGAGGSGDENERLLTRLRDRLRRLKRGSGQGGGGTAFDTSPTKPNKLVKPRPQDQPLRISAPTVQQIPRTQRVLSANDHDHDIDGELDEGSGGHVEVDRARFSMIHGDASRNRNHHQQGTSRTLENETAYMPILRS